MPQNLDHIFHQILYPLFTKFWILQKGYNKFALLLEVQFNPFLYLLQRFQEKYRNIWSQSLSPTECKLWNGSSFCFINGTRAPIKCPVQVSRDYCCYKQFYSLIIQTLWYNRRYFMNIECMQVSWMRSSCKNSTMFS